MEVQLQKHRPVFSKLFNSSSHAKFAEIHQKDPNTMKLQKPPFFELMPCALEAQTVIKTFVFDWLFPHVGE